MASNMLIEVMRVFVVVLVALEEALKDKVVPYPVRATEAHKQPCAGLLEDGEKVLRVFCKVVVRTPRTRRRAKPISI